MLTDFGIRHAQDPSVEHLAGLGDDPYLTFFFVQVDGTILHGWSSPLRLKSAFQ
jgi:hypothetical protein